MTAEPCPLAIRTADGYLDAPELVTRLEALADAIASADRAGSADELRDAEAEALAAGRDLVRDARALDLAAEPGEVTRR